ncbi:MAG: tetratricopeptide repeat protein [Methylococcaceae bacterium]|nr:tetratricopeptide repeat protein [Methylococcaceae bacterium]
MNRNQNTVDTSGLDNIFNISPKNLQSQISAVEKLIALGHFQEAEHLCDQLIARLPNNPAGFVNLALIALKQQNSEIALERCEQFLRRFPNNQPLLNYKIESLTSLERFNEAEELCQDICKLFPIKPIGFIGLARISIKKQDFKLTLERCEQFIACFPNELSLLHLKSAALINLERFEEAEQACRLLTERFPDSPFGYAGLTKIALLNQDFKLTLERCEQFMPCFPDELSFLHLKSVALINLERLEEAEQICRLIIKNFPDKPLGYAGLTKIASLNQDFILTLERCEQYMPNFPDELSFLHLKSEVLINLERLEEAEQLCRFLIKRFPDRPFGYAGLTKIALKMQDFKLTFERCEQWASIFSFHPSFLQLKAEALIGLSFFKEAERISIGLVDNYPKKPVGHLLLARISFQQGDFQKSVERCYKLLESFPNDIHVSQLLANTLIALFRFEEAKHIFQQIIRIRPDKPNGYFGIARVAAAQSQHEETLKHCDYIIELFPTKIEALSLKGNTLLALSRLEEAKILFEKMVYDFPHLVNGYVGLHQLYRKIEKHHSALDAILTAYQINPINITVINQYVTLLELMGKTEVAYALLERHVNKLKHDACLVPLVNLYSKYGETSKILVLLENNNRFFSENVDLQIKVGLALRNKGNIIAAFTLFQNYLDNNNISLAALKIKFRVYEQLCLLQSIIENQGLFRHHFLSFISLPKPYLFKNPLYNEIVERIKTGNFTKCENFLDQDLDENPSNMIALFTRKIVEFTKELNDISAVFSESYLDIGESPVSALKVSEILISRIKNKTPTSMIRLGDGEGNYLTYPPQYEHWQNNDIEDIQRVWWGDVKIEHEDDKPIKALFAESVLNADILGIPDLVRRVRDIASFDNLANHRHNRGIEAIFHHLSVNKGLFATKQKTILTSCHSHTDLEFWDLYRYILTNVSKVTAITCHPDFARVLHDRFGITTVKTILIPSEHRHSHNFNIHEENNCHYPDYFERIINELTVEKGDVFLVAAGFLGKIYCNEIKNKGGISIDIGSTADIWMGYSTRMEHEYLHPIL